MRSQNWLTWIAGALIIVTFVLSMLLLNYIINVIIPNTFNFISPLIFSVTIFFLPCLIGLIAGISTFYLHRNIQLKEIYLPKIFKIFFEVEICTSKQELGSIKLFEKTERIEEYSASKRSAFWAFWLYFTITILLVILLIFGSCDGTCSYYLINKQRDLDPIFIIFFSALLAASIGFLFTLFLQKRDTLSNFLKDKIERRINSINEKMLVSSRDIIKYQNLVNQISNDFYPGNLTRIKSISLPSIEQPFDYIAMINEYLRERKEDITEIRIQEFQESLEECLKAIISVAKEHYEKLSQQKEEYAGVYRSYEETARIINREGSSSKIASLNKILEDLVSEPKINMLSQKDWGSFSQNLSLIHNELFSLRIGSDLSGRESITTLECAYRALGILSTSSDEDVRNAYRVLMKACHPDSNPLGNDGNIRTSRSREINIAYELIVSHRGMRR